MSVTNRSTCSIDYRLIYDFTTNYFDKDYMIWCKNAKISARSLRSLLIIYEILKSQIYFFDKGIIMSITDKSTLLYRHNMWLTNKILRYRRIVRFKRQNAKISARSLAPLARNNL